MNLKICRIKVNDVWNYFLLSIVVELSEYFIVYCFLKVYILYDILFSGNYRILFILLIFLKYMCMFVFV